MINLAIVGWGNVSRGVANAIQRNPDTSLVGIITRRPESVKAELGSDSKLEIYGVQGSDSFESSEGFCRSVDVAILCGGSATDLPQQGPKFARCFNTVDSFDTHIDIPNYLEQMNVAAKAHNNLAVCCAGWDPGTFSIERMMALSFIPGGKPYTFWGPGVSQGHSDAIRRVEGIADGIQYTLPIEAALEQVRAGTNPDLTTRQKHLRDCYVTLKPGADPEKVRTAIVTMPKYFEDYDTRVTLETPEQIAERKKAMPHGGFVMVSGKTGQDNKALIEYKNQWASNPEATGSILVACARANYRMHQEGKTGAITMADIPPVMYHPLERADVIKTLM